MKWGIEKKTSAGFVLALLMAVVMGLVSYRSMSRLTETAAWLNHTHQVLAKLDVVLTSMQDIENGARGFILGGDQSFLDLYESAVVQVGQNMDELRRLTADNLNQQRKLDSLRPSIERRIAIARTLVTLRQSKGLEPEVKIATGAGKDLMNQIRSEIADMRAEETLRLSEREAQAKSSAHAAVQLLSSSTCLIIILLGFLFYVITHDTAVHRQAVEMLRESDLRFRIVARATNEAVWDWNLVDNSVWWNRSVQTQFGYTDDQVGQDRDWWVQNVHPADRDRVTAGILGRVRSNEDFWSAEYRFRRADGTYADLFDRGYVMRREDGQAVRMIGAMQDITERKLEQEMARARDAALESARLKSQFLANMSHEIRTPMNSVIGMTGLLLDSELTDEQRDYAETVRLSGESLLTIINDILDFSKIEAGKLVFETVDFEPRATVEEVIGLLAEQARSKKLKLESSLAEDVPVQLRGDPGRLRQVLTNLVGNAIKFTHQGGVTLRVQKENETETHLVLRFEVEDTGIGIPEKAREQLFQPFSQVDSSSSRRYGGTGLGLAISNQLVKLMAGRIGATSVLDKGSTFWFTARFEKAVAPIPGSSAENDPHPVQPQTLSEDARMSARILVAEDNIFNQKVVLRQLQQMSYSVDVVANGVEVLEALDRIPYDLILMDCQMPEMDGYEATLEIRRRQCNSKHTPIVAMTAHVMKEDRDKCLAAGMDDFLSKPVRVGHLESVLNHWLSQPLSGIQQVFASPSSNLGNGEPPSAPPSDGNPGLHDGIAVADFSAASAVTKGFSHGNGGEQSSDNQFTVSMVRSRESDNGFDGDVVDLDLFTEVAGDEAEPRRELAVRYLKQTTQQLAKIEAAIRDGNAADLKRVAHSAAGSSAMFGMIALAPCLRKLESIGHKGQLDDASQVFAQATQEFERIKQFLLAHEEIQTNDNCNCTN